MKVSAFARRGLVAAALTFSTVPLVASAAFAAGSAPAQPAGLTLTSAPHALIASWTESTTGKIVFTATATSAGHPTRSCHTHQASCLLVPVANGATYSVTVVAKNADGTSAPSAAATATVGAPLPPQRVHVRSAKGGQALVFWAPPIANGLSHVTGYTATATSSSSGPFTCSTTGAHFCELAGLNKGTVYSVSVTSTNKFGSSSPSKPASFTAK